MATCRGCFFAPITIPASPRVPLKVSDKENVTQNGHDIDDSGIPHKRALFEAEKPIENQA